MKALLAVLPPIVAAASALADNRSYFLDTKAKAEAGDAGAQIELARCYKHGTGTEKDMTASISVD